jgi:hypothetical protein
MAEIPNIDIEAPSRVSAGEYRQRIERLLEWIRAETPPFIQDSETAKADRLKSGEADFFWFCKTYFPHYFTHEFAEMHRQVIPILGEPGLKVISWPRGFAKTVIITQFYPLWKALHKKIHFALIIGKSKDDAKDLLLPIKLECEANERLKQDFGELVGSNWEDNDFTLKMGPRFLGVGRGQQIRGRRWRQYRPDYIDLDDIEDDVLAENPKRVKQLLRWFFESVIPAAYKRATIVWSGTLLAKKSALARLLDPQADLTGEGIPIEAVRMKFAATQADGSSAWPEYWPIYALEAKRRQMGTAAYMKEFECRVSDEESLFQREWFRNFEKRPEKPVVVIYNDPAISRTPKSSMQATVAMGVDLKTMDYYVLHARLRRESYDRMLDGVFDLYFDLGRSYTVLCVAFEANGFQVVLESVYEEKCRKRKIRLPLRKVIHTDDKDIRVQGLVPIAEGGHIWVQRGHSDQNLLLDQFEFYGQMEKDGPDACEAAVKLLKGISTRYEYESVGRRMGLKQEEEEYAHSRFSW